MPHLAARHESIRALTHELAHVERLFNKLQRLPPAKRGPAADLLDLVADLRRDGARRLRYMQSQSPT